MHAQCRLPARKLRPWSISSYTYTGSKGSPTPEHATVLFLADGDVRLILTAKLKFLAYQYQSHPTANGSGTFPDVKSCKLGCCFASRLRLNWWTISPLLPTLLWIVPKPASARSRYWREMSRLNALLSNKSRFRKVNLLHGKTQMTIKDCDR